MSHCTGKPAYMFCDHTHLCFPAVPLGEYESHHLPPQVQHTWTTPQSQFFTSPSSEPTQPHPSHPPPGHGPYYHPLSANFPVPTPFISPPTGAASLVFPTYSQLPQVPPGPAPSTPAPLTLLPAQPTPPQLATSHTVQTVATSQPPVQASVATGSSSSMYMWV